MLQCHAKGCTTNNYPLVIADAELEEIEADFNVDFMKKLLYKLDWSALYQTTFDLGILIPEAMPEEADEDFLKNLHHVLLEVSLYIPVFFHFQLRRLTFS